MECAFDTLPDHILFLIAQHLSGGTLENFRRTCKHFRQAANLRTKTLDFHEVCGWGDNTSALPPCAVTALQEHPNVKRFTVPSSWCRSGIVKLLQHLNRHSKDAAAAASSSRWHSSSDGSSDSTSGSRSKQLTCLELHFQAVCPSLCHALAALAPGVTRLELSLDLAFELTTKQARRMAALSSLPNLHSLWLDADLGPEALASLAGLTRLQDLRLLGHSHWSHSARSLQALCGLSQLSTLSFKWTAGRTMTNASPLSRLTTLKRLDMWLGANQELPMCSNKPLRGLLAAVGALSQLTELQLLRGLYLSWELRKIVHLDGLTDLQVLGLHDSVMSEEELSLLAPCVALTDLRVDTIRLTAPRSTVGPAAAAAAAAAAVAATAASAAAAAAAAAAAVAAAGGASSVMLPHQPATDYALAAAAVAAPAVLAAAGAVVLEPTHQGHHHQPLLYRHLALALVTLRRLQQLQCNMLHLGLYHLSELCPVLTHLSPLPDSLAPGGHGVVWNLAAIEGHPQLQTLGLMLGALGATCSYCKTLSGAGASGCQSARAMATSIMRVLLQSAGLGGMTAAVNGVTLQQVLQVLASLPRLQQVQLWGHAGGLCGKTLSTVTVFMQEQRALARRSQAGSSSGVLLSQGSCPLATASNVGAAVGGLLCSFGSLLTPTDLHTELRTVASVPCPAAEKAGPGTDTGGKPFASTKASDGCSTSNGRSSRSSSSGRSCNTRYMEGVGSWDGILQKQTQKGMQPQPCPVNPMLAGNSSWVVPDVLKHRGRDQSKASALLQHTARISWRGSAQDSAPTKTPAAEGFDTADVVFVVQVLRRLPDLQLLQLHKCRHLEGEGQALAVHCCGRYSDATVVYR